MSVEPLGGKMKTTIQLLLIAAALAMASASGIAATEAVGANNGATSVAEMMQRKQDHQLRAQLVTEGRGNEVWQLDEDNARRMREKTEDRYTTVNKVLSRSSNVEGPDRVTPLNERIQANCTRRN
jgi:hypothetical protein